MSPVNVLLSAPPGYWEDYAAPLPRACAEAGVPIRLAAGVTGGAADGESGRGRTGDAAAGPTDGRADGRRGDPPPALAPGEVDYLVFAPGGPRPDFAAMGRLKAVLSLWAGVERVVEAIPARLPLARMVDPAMTAGMVQWVLGHALRHHLGMDLDILGTGPWRRRSVPLTAERRVGVLGLGALGTACAQALAATGFRVSGWSRTPREVAGITCHHGEDGLSEVLRSSEILALLLPDTAQTRNLLDARRLALLPAGAVVLNSGRGVLIEDAALLAALDSKRLGHATLDVFRTEPLPPAHPFWRHPRVTVTPHIAAETRPQSASRVIAENIRRAEAGEPLLHLVDRSAGY